MRTLVIQLGTLLLWMGLGILGAVVYGIVNDQITVTLSPEYFSVFKRRQFAPALEQAGLLGAPTRVQAILVGTLATWWFGLFLGVVLGISGMIGRRPALPTRLYVRAVGGVMLFSLGLSVVCGVIGYFAEPFIRPDATNWPFLAGIQEVRRAFVVGFWHNGAYLGGLVGTVVAILWGQRERSLLAQSLLGV